MRRGLLSLASSCWLTLSGKPLSSKCFATLTDPGHLQEERRGRVIHCLVTAGKAAYEQLCAASYAQLHACRPQQACPAFLPMHCIFVCCRYGYVSTTLTTCANVVCVLQVLAVLTPHNFKALARSFLDHWLPNVAIFMVRLPHVVVDVDVSPP